MLQTGRRLPGRGGWRVLWRKTVREGVDGGCYGGRQGGDVGEARCKESCFCGISEGADEVWRDCDV